MNTHLIFLNKDLVSYLCNSIKNILQKGHTDNQRHQGFLRDGLFTPATPCPIYQPRIFSYDANNEKQPQHLKMQWHHLVLRALETKGANTR